MLALTPMPLQTAGERALFAELNRWDTGGAVRSAVVASIPVVEEGALQRRLSDAVLFVPEGIALIRVVEVERQTGVVTARPDGAWTIGPGGGPGDVLQLAGGGSTPLDGLMRAGMDAAMRLRRAGLEPGRIGRLTVLVGALTGLEPADGDLGEGDQVALLEPRSLLLGIARAARYAATDNPRLWTTADVRAALESLGLQGRGPSVDQLNGEGFAYSPYVLRRPELLAPAGIVAAGEAASAAATAAATAATTAPPAGPPAPPAPVPPAAAPPAWPAAPAQSPPLTGPDTFGGPVYRDTVDVGSSMEDSGGIGGLFASAGPDETTDSPAPQGTSVFPAGSPPPLQPMAAPPRLVDQRMVEHGQPGQAGSRKLFLLIGAAMVVVVLVVLGAIVLIGRGGGGHGAAGQGATASASPSPQLKPGTVQEVDGVAFTLQVVKVDDTCIGHAYGAVGDFFNATNCTGLSRALYSAQLDGKPLVVAVSKVRMPDAASATALKALADRDGTGNVSDLLREGVTYPGAPQQLVDSQYDSSPPKDDVVTIAVSSWVAGRASGSSAPLKALANSGLSLNLPAPPGK